MELIDKGKHCSEEFCHQLDFLPMQCKLCKGFFCAEHFRYESHRCAEATSDKLSYQIPTCDLCQQTIEFKRGRDLDLCLAEHMAKCQVGNEKMKTIRRRKCSHSDCKSKDLFRVACDGCAEFFCKSHRIPEVHKCKSLTLESCAVQQAKQQQKLESRGGKKIFTV